MTTAFEDYCNRLRAKYGDKFSASGLAEKFRPYFGSHRRIKVRFSGGTVKFGTVSGTTGWRPSLMLMLRQNAHGSFWLLSDKDEIVAVQAYSGKGYRLVMPDAAKD
jgi:hypothetical protein